MARSLAPRYQPDWAPVPDDAASANENFVHRLDETSYNGGNSAVVVASYYSERLASRQDQHGQVDPHTVHGENMANPTREEIDALIGKSEAQTETKIARFEGKLDLVLSKLDAASAEINSKFTAVGERLTEVRADVRADHASTRANIWVAFVGILALIVAIALLYPTFFDMGSKIREMVVKEVHEVQPSSVPK
jgi:hypothetical protein